MPITNNKFYIARFLAAGESEIIFGNWRDKLSQYDCSPLSLEFPKK